MSRAVARYGTWIGWAFFADLANALALTFGYMFARPVTMQYPDKEKWLPYSRYRGHHFLKRDDEGEIKCVACELCARICPCDCIEGRPLSGREGQPAPGQIRDRHGPLPVLRAGRGRLPGGRDLRLASNTNSRVSLRVTW